MSNTVVIVGDSICGGDGEQKFAVDSDAVYLCGYNTFLGSKPQASVLLHDGAGEVVGAVNGIAEITDRVVSVRGNLARYLPEIGDIVIGRISEVCGNRWRVDIHSAQDAVMPLSNVAEPGGELRRRGRGDELGMRQMFDQGQLIAAEVQRISPDGVVFLHMRSGEKHGRLTSFGHLIHVRPSLVKRAKHQFFSILKYNARVVVGMNGCVWVAWQEPEDFRVFDSDDCMCVARVANVVRVLSQEGLSVHPNTIESMLAVSDELGLSPFDILLPHHRDCIVAAIADTFRLKRCRS